RLRPPIRARGPVLSAVRHRSGAAGGRPVRLVRKVAGRAAAAAESLTGKRFALLVASSLAATTAIVATGLSATGPADGPLAALLGRSLASDTTPASSVTNGPGGTSPISPAAVGGEAGGQASPAPSPLPAPAAPAPAGGEEESPASKTDTPEIPTAAEPSGPVGPIKHVFVISVSSPGYEQSLGKASEMPYLSSLAPKGQVVPGYRLLSENPLPNNVALVSGQRPNPDTESDCAVYASFPPTAAPEKKSGRVNGSGCIYPVEALTLADQISGARMTWRGYIEDMADE